jgi:hypothetical protein
MEIYWKSKPYKATIISIGIKVFVLLYIVIAVCECAYTLSFWNIFTFIDPETDKAAANEKRDNLAAEAARNVDDEEPAKLPAAG